MLVGTSDVRKNLLSQHEQQPHTIHSIATASGRRKGRGKRGRALDPKRSTSRNRPGQIMITYMSYYYTDRLAIWPPAYLDVRAAAFRRAGRPTGGAVDRSAGRD
jgi:hypothetical protein